MSFNNVPPPPPPPPSQELLGDYINVAQSAVLEWQPLPGSALGHLVDPSGNIVHFLLAGTGAALHTSDRDHVALLMSEETAALMRLGSRSTVEHRVISAGVTYGFRAARRTALNIVEHFAV